MCIAASLLFTFLPMTAAAQTVVAVSTHGANPDDGVDDRISIQSAINFAIAIQRNTGQPSIVEFEPGVYNLRHPPAGLAELITIDNATDVTLRGAIGDDGAPATVLQRNVTELVNEMEGADVISIDDGTNVTLENLVLDNSPGFTSAGECVVVDVANDAVEVDVFENLPHFEGMQAFSANVWDLETRDLKVGVPHLSISTNINNFPEQWHLVPGGDGRRYRLENMGFSEHLQVGDGVSWHFNVASGGHQLRASGTNGLTLENIHITNGPEAVTSYRDVGDLTCRRVKLAPIGNQLAVGPRDGMYTAASRGEYVYDQCHWEGVRWDPLALFNKLGYVENVVDARTIEFFWYRSDNYSIDDLQATLWFETGVVEATITDHQKGATSKDASGRTIRCGTLTFADDLPEGFGPGSVFAPHRRTKTVIRNSVFQNNYGRAPYLSGVNMEIVGNTFRNNGYALAIGLSSPGAGGFSRNVVIRDNKFSRTTWSSVVSTSIPTSGAIRFYENHPAQFTTESYNDTILIENNRFEGINFNPDYAAIDLRNAQNVTIRCNEYIDTPNTVQIDEATTDVDSIIIENDGGPGGCANCDGVNTDLAPPFGELNSADIIAWIFNPDPSLAEPTDVLDGFDTLAFLSYFAVGCMAPAARQ